MQNKDGDINGRCLQECGSYGSHTEGTHTCCDHEFPAIASFDVVFKRTWHSEEKDAFTVTGYINNNTAIRTSAFVLTDGDDWQFVTSNSGLIGFPDDFLDHLIEAIEAGDKEITYTFTITPKPCNSKNQKETSLS